MRRQSGSVVLCRERSESLNGGVVIEGCASVSVLEVLRPYDSGSASVFSKRKM